METEAVIYDDGVHKCVMFNFDDEEYENQYLAVKQYLIIHQNTGILIDPGSKGVFDELYKAIQKYIPIENIKFITFSHQDPDVAGAISEWTIATQAKILLPNLWTRFMTHYGVLDMSRIHAVPNKGTKIKFGENYIYIIPAHFLHSPGNFSLYDSRSKILFSGDIGTNISHYNEEDKTDFESIKSDIQGFHERYMAGNKFCKAWVNKVREEEVAIIAPQHGILYKEDNVNKFLNWFENLQCGGDLMDKLY
ncbi:MBL fold metallo-hydrolase [Sulfurospirillum arcachonense]|uniref:MBL fold metallo-hydrolase n=1 Tax=Sulfurospirillum arcachonense TaxID=57666 RepID=UPI00046A4E5E|nr:MBL fold metallo-hydrolase [Sulfurospirillum arcachonense]